MFYIIISIIIALLILPESLWQQTRKKIKGPHMLVMIQLDKWAVMMQVLIYLPY